MKTWIVMVTFGTIILAISFSGCISNNLLPGNTILHPEEQYKKGNYNNFFVNGDIKTQRAWAYTSGLEILDHYLLWCGHENNDGTFNGVKYVDQDSGTGWKFVYFEVNLHNNMSNGSLEFWPNRVEDTDRLDYGSNQLVNNNCGYGLVSFDPRIKPKSDAHFYLVYKIPSSAIPDKFYYEISASNYSWSDSGELDLR